MTSAVRTVRLVWIPALLTLAVTLARLTGELCGWPPRWFSTAAGGGAALVGIVWLVPLFGSWFGWRLARAGGRPPHPGRAALLQAVAVALYVGGFQTIVHLVAFDTSAREGLVRQLLAMGAVSVAATLVSMLAWPRLGIVNLSYGLLARLPVAVVTFVAVLADLGTHFEKLGPQDYQGFSPAARAAWLAFTQLVHWPAFTVAVGGLFGTLAAWSAGRRAAAGA